MKEQFTADEWNTLLYAPVMLNYTVANADGSADSRESGALVQVTVMGMGSPDPLTSEVCAELAENISTILRDMPQSFIVGEVLEEAARLADRVASSGGVAPYKRYLVDVATATAGAAGPLVGSKISADEQMMIDVTKEILGITD